MKTAKQIKKEARELTNEERWQQWVDENNICRICGSERTICGGEVKHD